MDLHLLAEKSLDGSFERRLLTALAKNDLTSWTNAPSQTGRTQATWYTRTEYGNLKLDEVPMLFTRTTAKELIVVVENIDVPWILQCGKCWNLPGPFFADHALDVAKDKHDPWYTIMRSDIDKTSTKPLPISIDMTELVGQPAWQNASVWHTDGCLAPAHDPKAVREQTLNHIRRQQGWDSTYGAYSASRISLWDSRSSSLSFMLILVDAPYACKPVDAVRPPAQLHLPLARNRGGLVIPQLAGTQVFSLALCLHHFLRHGWHIGLLFESQGRMPAMGPDTFAYILVASTWETNLRSANKLIKHISFEELLEPSTAINNRLHGLRRDLDNLRVGVALVREYMPPQAQRPLAQFRGESGVNIKLPSESFDSIEQRATELQRFLMDTFTLLLSSISVREAELGVQQSIRTQRLTTLAFIYVPMSFVTGIFGMNITEINGSYLPVWVPIVTLGVTMVVTVVVFAGYAQWQRHRRRGRFQTKRFRERE